MNNELREIILYNTLTNDIKSKFYVDENDNKQGICEYYEGDNIYEIYNYKDDMLHGIYEKWCNYNRDDIENLNVEIKEINNKKYIKIHMYNYTNNLKNGEFKIWKVYYERNYSSFNFKLEEFGFYLNDKLHGNYRKRKNYEIIEKQFNNGDLILHLLWKHKNINDFSYENVNDLSNYVLIEQQEYKNNLKNVEHKEWYLNEYQGKRILKKNCIYKDGNVYGEYKEWYKNGKLSKVYNYTIIENSNK